MSRQQPQTSALIMAARRPGVADPLCAMGDVSHKCMLRIHGQIMLERVIAALLDSGCVGKVYVSIDDAGVLLDGERLRGWLAQNRVQAVAAEGNLADSVLATACQIPDDGWPLLITTGDNALHTAELIQDFVEQCDASNGDVALGLTRETDVTPVIPDSNLNWHWLRDGGFSSCNLYLLRNRKALHGVGIFRTGGQFGKKHWRILKSFGLLPFILYKFRWTTTDKLIRRIGDNLGLEMRAVFLPYAFAPIDVDNLKSFTLSERILAAREQR